MYDGSTVKSDEWGISCGCKSIWRIGHFLAYAVPSASFTLTTGDRGLVATMARPGGRPRGTMIVQSVYVYVFLIFFLFFFFLFLLSFLYY